jgi:hypothetical protein
MTGVANPASFRPMPRPPLSRLVFGFAVVGLAAACAPRMANNHYQRWTAFEEAAKAEAAAEEAAAARIEANASGAKAADTKSAPKPAAPPPPPPPTATYNSLSGETPPVTRTATKSRASKADDDVY